MLLLIDCNGHYWNECAGLHSGVVVSTVAHSNRILGSIPSVCVGSLCTPASSHHPKTCMSGGDSKLSLVVSVDGCLSPCCTGGSLDLCYMNMLYWARVTAEIG